MSWIVNCYEPHCKATHDAKNIVDLIERFCDADGWFVCQTCKQPTAYVRKEFQLQEKDREPWRPFLRGIVQLANDVGDDPKSAYRPFVFLATYERADNPVKDFWFCYYKDMRARGGRLKLGQGPGGPPRLSSKQVLRLVGHALHHNILRRQDVEDLLTKCSKTRSS